MWDGSSIDGVTSALVTGAAGFIGCHLMDALASSDVEIIGLDNERSGDWSRVTAPCRRVERDLADLSPDELVDLCRDIDVVFHLAAEKHNSAKATPQRIVDVNVSATRRLFDAASRAGCPKVVFTSSLYAYGSMGPHPMHETDAPEPNTEYGKSKLAGEQMLRGTETKTSFGATVARLFFIYGPRQFAAGGYKSVIVSNFERLLRGEAPTVYGDGEQALDYVYVEDAVNALLAMTAREHDGKMVNIASGRAITVNELTATMLAVSGSTVEPLACPPDWTAGSCRVGDPTAAAAELEWKAETPIEVGLQRCWDWMQEERNA
jgi:UDP-glucose 4-epimerase